MKITHTNRLLLLPFSLFAIIIIATAIIISTQYGDNPITSSAHAETTSLDTSVRVANNTCTMTATIPEGEEHIASLGHL